uniref:Uncharacterized protein n=1 Tax=Ralstonia syzygii R24 TaxID=907261 RepID=G3ABF0_9RALS|nr:exported hypothetical protein [Ralstonia syzygii R24]
MAPLARLAATRSIRRTIAAPGGSGLAFAYPSSQDDPVSAAGACYKRHLSRHRIRHATHHPGHKPHPDQPRSLDRRRQSPRNAVTRTRREPGAQSDPAPTR